MLTFCGFDLELTVDGVLDQPGGLWSAVDGRGGHWLILEADRTVGHLAWLCAPISRPALDAIVGGRATPRDAFLHSATGTVELIKVEDGQAVPDRCLRGEEVPERLLPPADWHLDATSDPAHTVPVERRARPRRPSGVLW